MALPYPDLDESDKHVIGEFVETDAFQKLAKYIEVGCLNDWAVCDDPAKRESYWHLHKAIYALFAQMRVASGKLE